jgi:hypothetical protein
MLDIWQSPAFYPPCRPNGPEGQWMDLVFYYNKRIEDIPSALLEQLKQKSIQNLYLILGTASLILMILTKIIHYSKIICSL